MNLKFTYSNSPIKRYSHIERVEYDTGKEKVVLSGDEILNHHLPINCDMYLFSDTATYAVSHNGLEEIRVSKTV